MKTNFTLGPWSVDDDGYIQSDSGEVAVLRYRPNMDEMQANGRLLAAAPELYRACRAALDWLNAFGADSPIVFGGEGELATLLGLVLQDAGEEWTR